MSKVFVSYSHDTPAHAERVLQLAWALRKNGSDVELDQFHNEEIVDWPRWCNEQTSREHSDFVVCVCTAEYRRRIEGKVPPEKGKGAYWEGALLDDDIYDEKGNGRIISVLLDEEPESSIPRFLRGWTHCRMNRFQLSAAGYEHLIRMLTHQAKVEKNAIGPIPVLPTQHASDAPAASREAGFRADIARIDKYVPTQLIGREGELALLNDAWEKVRQGATPRPHVLTIVALGGEGKTSLVAKWAADLAGRDWPGCEAAFAWSFYSQGTRDQATASSDLFLKEALLFFGDEAMAKSNQGAFEKGRRLASLVGARRALLILDGLEPLQYAPTSPTPGELKDQGLAALLKSLAAINRGLCIVTTRYSIPDLRAWRQTTAPEKTLPRLSKTAGVALLKVLGVMGTQQEFEKLVEDVQGHALTLNLLGTYLRDAHAGDIRKRDLVTLEAANADEQNGHAFHVMDAYVKWFESEGEDEQRRVRSRGLQPPAPKRIVGPVPSPGGLRALAILRLLGLFDRPADAGCLGALLKAPAIAGLTDALIGLNEAQRNIIFQRLVEAKLLAVNRDASGALLSLDAHPLIREYFAQQVKTGSARASRAVSGALAGNIGADESTSPDQPAGARVGAREGACAPQTSDVWRAGHRRLYEYLCATTKEGDKPTLEDLQPLYQAVAHGCQAGLQQETCDKVYCDRILRGTGDDGFYSTGKLGAIGSDLGAVACFFEQPWSRVLSAFKEADQSWLLNQASYRLRALGRLTEAVKPMRAGLDTRVTLGQFGQAAASANNLSELELTLGEVADAVRDAEQSVTYADKSRSAFLKMGMRTTHADALCQVGHRDEALRLFRDAEKMQTGRQPDYTLLYSVQGFRYCDLLLAAAERSAWKTGLECADVSALLAVRRVAPQESGDMSPHSKMLREVEQRAARTLKWVSTQNWLLDIALDHLTLGRVALYRAILEKSSLDPCRSSLDQAVDGLRRAGTTHHIPRALLPRAWFRFLDGKRTGFESAQSDLDDAWEIAERGPMKLFMADIHLYRARLFGLRIGDCGLRNEEVKYPWESPAADLAAAKKLIAECGYHRRDEELADAEAALKAAGK